MGVCRSFVAFRRSVSIGPFRSVAIPLDGSGSSQNNALETLRRQRAEKAPSVAPVSVSQPVGHRYYEELLVVFNNGRPLVGTAGKGF
jgi:hypothetical protein